jgi:hypothetical protein
VSVGLAAVSVGVFTGFFVAADDRLASLRARCPDRCASEMQGEIDEGRAFETASNGFFIASLVLAATGALLVSIAALDGQRVDLGLLPTGLGARVVF